MSFEEQCEYDQDGGIYSAWQHMTCLWNSMQEAEGDPLSELPTQQKSMQYSAAGVCSTDPILPPLPGFAGWGFFSAPIQQCIGVCSLR